MPWDNSLNADVKRSYDYHCMVTAKLGDKYTRKFSMKTPKLIAREIKRLIENEWDKGVSGTERIIHDCNLTLDIMYTVYQSGGSIVA